MEVNCFLSGVKYDVVPEEHADSVAEAVGATSASILTTSLIAASISVFSALYSPSSSITATLLVLE